VQITGDLKNPGPQALNDTPLTLIDAISRSGGAMPDADLQRVHLTRNGKVVELDVNAALDRGEISQNVLLQNGDLVNVPDRTDSRVFVIGEVLKPTSLPMNRGRLTLADAIAGVNSIDPKSADPRLVYVIRGARDNPSQPTVYRLDMTQIDALLLMTKFPLQPLDVVYVGTASAVRFNRILDQISPTLQALFFTRELAQ
jgi:polysaccharide export outer membrane protein